MQSNSNVGAGEGNKITGRSSSISAGKNNIISGDESSISAGLSNKIESVNDEDWIRGKFTLTPHAAFFSPQGLEDLRTKAVKTAISYLLNRDLRNCQNIECLNTKI